MVKIGPPERKSPEERLAKFAWGSQDGGGGGSRLTRGEEEEDGARSQASTSTEGELQGVSPLPRRERSRRRGESADGRRADGDRGRGAQKKETEPSLKQIMAAIQACQSTLTEHIDGLRVDLSFLKQDMQSVKERTTEAEQRISDLEDVVRPLEGSVQSAQKDLAAHTDKLGDMEDRLRRNNIRLVGFPEGAEGRQVEDFLEQWLKDNMDAATFSRLFAIERAHRVPTRAPRPGAHPRPLIARILHFRDKENILRAARTKGDLSFNGNRISIYPDFSAATQKQRASFTHVKKRLRDSHLVYSMMYPAKLRVVDGGKVHFFNTPVEASRWLDIRGRPRPNAAGEDP